ncbi:hypothetical protein H8959_018291 [Pygathrix nigripes]
MCKARFKLLLFKFEITVNLPSLPRFVTRVHTRPGSRRSIASAYHPGMPPAAAAATTTATATATAAAAGLVGSAAEPEPELRPELWPES